MSAMKNAATEFESALSALERAKQTLDMARDLVRDAEDCVAVYTAMTKDTFLSFDERVTALAQLKNALRERTLFRKAASQARLRRNLAWNEVVAVKKRYEGCFGV